MKALVLSDIHGNGEALSAVMKEAKRRDWREIWFLGDLCGYGPDSDFCFRLLRKEKLIFLDGNHDLYMSGDLSGSIFSDPARKALILGRSDVGPGLRLFLSRNGPSAVHKGVEMVHGSPADPGCRYILSEEDVREILPRLKKKILLFGHTHVQEYYTVGRGNIIYRGRPGNGPLRWKTGKVLINPGSVGQPRDGDNRAAWGIIDTRKKEFSFFRTSYDYGITQQKMKDRGYPEFLIERLGEGH